MFVRSTAREEKIFKKHLASIENFSIDLVSEDDYTHTIQISNSTTKQRLQTLLIDPTDNTITGCLSEALIKQLQDQAEVVLNKLSEILLTQFGAKEFILVPEDTKLAEFVAPEHSGFTRFRHCERHTLQASTQAILNTYESLSIELNRRLHFITSEAALLKDCDPIERYEAIHRILETADFTQGKQEEYKNEDIQGKMSRFKNKYVTPIFMLDEENQIIGMIRVLALNDHFAYLSDEVIHADIVELDQFKGATMEEKAEQRKLFLLAYLMNKTCEMGLATIQHVLIIAASGREQIYDQVGYQAFPASLANYKTIIKLSPPKQVLIELKEQIKALPAPEKKRFSSLNI